MTQIKESTRRYVLGVLVVVYTFNFIDRQILSILLEAIKLDLGLSDTQLGLLTGFAFALFYATLGIPDCSLGVIAVTGAISLRIALDDLERDDSGVGPRAELLASA